MEEYRETSPGLGETNPTRDLFGTQVLTDKGVIVGKIVDIHLSLTRQKILGIRVKPGFTKKPVYIGVDYIARIGAHSTKLKITPTFMLLGKKVIASDGKILGAVSGATRSGKTVNVKTLKIKRFFLFNRYLSYSTVRKVGENILLKLDYDEAKKHLKKYVSS